MLRLIVILFIIKLYARNDENIFPHMLLINNTQVSTHPKTFANNSSANTKLSKTQLHYSQENF